VIDYATAITGRPVSRKWIKRFHECHPEIRARWTHPLEKCHAQSLNPTAVASFFEVLQEVIEMYDIPPKNIYNADEKGIQLGVGKKVLAFFDQDQKDIYSVEDGDRELVTVIEAVCADGTAIRPSVIFNANSGQYIAIRKNNLLRYYSEARQRAFSPTTIQAAFRKTGIWPLNPKAINPNMFAPALNTTTKPALPLAAEIPTCIAPAND